MALFEEVSVAKALLEQATLVLSIMRRCKLLYYAVVVHLRSNDTYCGALVYSDAPTNSVVDEEKSGLDAMVQHAE